MDGETSFTNQRGIIKEQGFLRVTKVKMLWKAMTVHLMKALETDYLTSSDKSMAKEISQNERGITKEQDLFRATNDK